MRVKWKVPLFYAVIPFLGAALAGGVIAKYSHRFVGQFAFESVREFNNHFSSVNAESLHSSLIHIVEEVRTQWKYAKGESDKNSERKQILADFMAEHPHIVRLMLNSRTGDWKNPGWEESFSVGREGHNFARLDADFPFQFDLAYEGYIELQGGYAGENEPYIRIAIPIARPKFNTPKEILTADVEKDWIAPHLPNNRIARSFLVDENGRLLAQNEESTFEIGNDLSHLPIVQMAQNGEKRFGQMQYREYPQQEMKIAAYHKIGDTGFVMVTQVPMSAKVLLLERFQNGLSKLALALFLVIGTASFFFGWAMRKAEFPIVVQLGQFGPPKGEKKSKPVEDEKSLPPILDLADSAKNEDDNAA